ncbi:MAG TPA: aldolase/citrate lyase family protein [Chloroflexota bacterium]|nr:aldolase/citrate lyase family protein [Chloroflexota bacterium]
MQPRPAFPELLRQTERTLVGTFLYMPEPEIVRVLGQVPLDFVIVDLEHGAYGVEGCAALLRAVATTSLYGVVRVADGNASAIGKALDLGADAVLVPHVDSVAAARAAVEAAKFPPRGQRGAYPYSAANLYGLHPDVTLPLQNALTAVWALVEGAEGVRNLDDIVRVEGLDAIFIGPVDLSHALGVPGQVDHPLVVEKVNEIRQVASGAGVAVAAYLANPSMLHIYGAGFSAVACSVDVDVLGRAYRQVLEALR